MSKICRQCGVKKELEQFRDYYNDRKGKYSICKDCEKINSRAKYLKRKGAARSDKDNEELKSIEDLYDLQRSFGLLPPNTDRHCLIDVDKVKALYETRAAASIPDELQAWLIRELTEDPDVYQDIYDKLKDSYAPIVRYDPRTFLPIRDSKYNATLDAILERFNKYEDEYYGK